MAGKAAVLSDGVRISDLLSVMILARVYPVDQVKTILSETGKSSVRERNLPAPLMVYYIIALWLYRQASYQEVLRCIFEAFNWMNRRSDIVGSSCKAAISQARVRLGEAPLERLCEQFARPIATKDTKGAYWREWLVTSLDGSTLDVGDTKVNSEAFGRPGASRGHSAYPQLRFCSLLENGTHVLFGTTAGSYKTGETTLALQVVTHLKPGMLCLADRQFYGFELWAKASQAGADLLWRVKTNLVLPCNKRLPDGSYLSTIYPSLPDRRHGDNGTAVRVIEYKLSTGADDEGETVYRLLTTILNYELAPALELAALYSQRWEIETTFDEFKTHLGGRDLILRSKTPEGARQEFWGLILAHHAVRAVMHDAASKVDEAPTRLSFTHSLNEIRRKLPLFLLIPPSEVANTV